MDDASSPMMEQRAVELIKKLRSVHRELATSPGQQRMAELRKTVGRILDDVDGPDAPLLISSARPGDTPQPSPTIAEENRRLTSETAALGKRVAELNADIERLTSESQSTSSAAASAGEGGETAPGLSTGMLATIKDGLKRCTRGENVTAEDLELPESEGRLYSLMKELLRFALDYEVGLNALLFQFSIGVSSKFDTQIRKGFQRIVRDRFRACLEDKEGSMADLKESLQRNHKFLIDLNLSYDTCLREGTRSLLEELNPSPVVQSRKRWLGYDWAGAVQDLTRMHGDRANLTREELWERFFYAPFRDKLADYLETEEEVF